jgi:glutamate-1-semialdehyde 2,1-aminomutase
MADFQARLNRVIPGGAHTYSRGFDQFPTNAPQILVEGKGSYVLDQNGKRYLDYGMALRAVTLGYANRRVNDAAIRQIERGNNLTRASLVELEAAELLTNIIPGAEMVKFAKNGSNVTTAATKLARAYTGRRYICIPSQQPFFSFDDWFIGKTCMSKGVPSEHSSTTLLFEYNNINSLARLFDAFPNQIAGVMLEPATTITPCLSKCTELGGVAPCNECPNNEMNFLHQVQALCKQNNALFILDEMITGFRWAIEGGAYFFGVQPDLMTFGKGMANGFAVAAITGRREVMEMGSIDKPGKSRTFLLSTTHGGEMSGLGAFIETVSIYKEENVCDHLWAYGKNLKGEANRIARELGLQDYFQIVGPDICLNFVTNNIEGEASLPYRTLFIQEMLKSGILMPWIAPSHSHKDSELNMTLETIYSSLKVYRDSLELGINTFLEGPEIKPVFRKIN